MPRSLTAWVTGSRSSRLLFLRVVSPELNSTHESWLLSPNRVQGRVDNVSTRLVSRGRRVTGLTDKASLYLST